MCTPRRCGLPPCFCSGSRAGHCRPANGVFRKKNWFSACFEGWAHPVAGRSARHPGHGMLRLGAEGLSRDTGGCSSAPSGYVWSILAALRWARAHNRTAQLYFSGCGKAARVTGLGLSRAENLMDATQNCDPLVEVSGILKAHAVNLFKISSDLRLLASGPGPVLASCGCLPCGAVQASCQARSIP